MKKIISLACMILSLFSFVACNMDGVNPKKTFDVLGISLNKIPTDFSSHFREIRGQLKNGSLSYVSKDNESKRGVSATEFVENVYSMLLKKAIEDIKNLKVDDETRPMQTATLDVFNYTQEIYTTDMIRIAKMIDEGKSDAEIDAAIEELENTKGKIRDEKFNKAHELIFAYADKHGIEYKFIKQPSVNYKKL